MTARRVTLTFDNGPTLGVTERVLELLERAGILTTFFVVGAKLDDPAAAALASEASRAGHWIGNHTLTHSVPLGERPDPGFAAREIGETQSRIGDLAPPAKLFRPYGRQGAVGPHLFSRAAIDYLLEHRFRTILWNSVPGDWRDPEGWVDSCLAQVTSREWSVVVLHDIRNACLARLPELLRRLADLDVTWEQDFPDSVTLTRAGRIVSLDLGHVADP